MVDALGLDMGEPLAVMREYIEVLRAALDGAGDLPGAVLPRPVDRRVPGAGAAGAAGRPRAADAGAGRGARRRVVLWLCGPAYIRDVAVPALARGRARAGKPLEGFEVVAPVPLAVTEDHAGVTQLFREELVRYLSLPFYRTMFRASGFGDALIAFDRDRAPGRDADAVPPALVDALGAIGDARRARAEVEAYRAAGATLPVVRPIGPPEAPHARGTIEAVAP